MIVPGSNLGVAVTKNPLADPKLCAWFPINPKIITPVPYNHEGPTLQPQTNDTGLALDENSTTRGAVAVVCRKDTWVWGLGFRV